MTDAAYRLQALVLLREGMRLFYDCPAISGESLESDNFFRKYWGKTGVIVSFPITLVGPLDSKGRVPGLYLKPKSINVRFEGEEEVHHGLNLHHFVLLDPTTTVTDEQYDTAQRVGDLPQPVQFYPGDRVRKGDDLLQVPCIVQEVKFDNDNEPLYVLAETQEDTEQRKAGKAAERAAAREQMKANPNRFPMMGVSRHDFQRTETCKGANLVLLERGPTYFLYNEPEKLSFASSEEELSYWAHDGLSRTFYGSRRMGPNWEWPLEMARELVEQGKGELILSSRMPLMRGMDTSPQYTVRRLHACFAQYRERVKDLALSVMTPPPEREKSLGEISRGLLELGND